MNCNKIPLNYLGIVKCIAVRMSAVYRNKAELEDIVNEGVLVLMDCIEKYDPDKGAKFETYASFRIKGAIIDFIRNQDWVPRSLRKKVKTVEDAYYKLQSETGENVSDEEVAAHLNISVDELNRTIGEVNSFFLLSYEELLLDNSAFNNCLAENTTEGHIYQEELRDIIAQSIDQLNENESGDIPVLFRGIKAEGYRADFGGYPVEGIPNPRKSTYENEIKTEKIYRGRGVIPCIQVLFCGGGVIANSRAVDVVANNLANADTAGYKRIF